MRDQLVELAPIPGQCPPAGAFVGAEPVEPVLVDPVLAVEPDALVDPVLAVEPELVVPELVAAEFCVLVVEGLAA